MISKELLETIRCPQALKEKNKYGADPGRLTLINNEWLVCYDTGFKYPIRNGVPILTIEEGAKWKDVSIENLPTIERKTRKGGLMSVTSEESRQTAVKVIIIALFLIILIARRMQ